MFPKINLGSLKIKAFIKIVSPFVLILTILFLFIYFAQIRMYKIKIEERQKGIIDLKLRVIENEIREVLQDLVYLSRNQKLGREIYKSGKIVPNALKELTEKYHDFLKAEKKFNSISLVEINGQEILKIDYNDGETTNITEFENIKETEDFKEAMKLKQGQTYISSFTQIFKDKRIESSPYKPILKFITPIYDETNNHTAFLISEHLAAPLINEIREANLSPLSQPLLVNNEGYFIIGFNPETEWGFIDNSKAAYSFQNIDLVLWEHIKNNKIGQTYRETGLYTFGTLFPLDFGNFILNLSDKYDKNDNIKPYFWKVISFVPKPAFQQWEKPFIYYLTAVYLTLLLVICYISWRQSVSISQKEMAFRQLINSEEKYKILLEKSNIGIFISENRKITYANLHFLKMIKIPMSQINHFKIENLFLPSDLETEKKKFLFFSSKKHIPSSLEAKLMTNELKKPLPVDLSISIIQKNAPEILVISVSDISQRKFREMELEAQNTLLKKIATEEKKSLYEQLQHADRLATLGQFSASVIHDINEPITNILGLAQLAEKNTSLPDETRQDIADIVTSSLHARTIIKNVLTFSRKSTGESSINLNEVISENLYLFENKSTKNGIKTFLNLDKNLPLFQADRSKITQIFVNLVTNAIAAMPEGGELHISTLFKDNKICFSVKDTGIGMDEATLTKIFDPFFTTKNPSEGTGLGLSVVKEIVNSYNGSINVISTPGNGSDFQLNFASS